MTADSPRELIPSFRDFSSGGEFELDSEGSIVFVESPEPEEPISPLTANEVAEILKSNPDALRTESWPRLSASSELAEKIPGILIHNYGGFVPFQAEGVWGPYEWYYRERGGGSSLGLAPIGTFPSATDSLYWASGEADEFQGSEGWIDRFLSHWVRLAPGPDGYWFEGRKVNVFRDEAGELDFTVKEGPEELFGWGNSAEEALADSRKPSAYLLEAGFSEELQERIWQAHELTVEKSRLAAVRVYPPNHPSFELN